MSPRVRVSPANPPVAFADGALVHSPWLHPDYSCVLRSVRSPRTNNMTMSTPRYGSSVRPCPVFRRSKYMTCPHIPFRLGSCQPPFRRPDLVLLPDEGPKSQVASPPTTTNVNRGPLPVFEPIHSLSLTLGASFAHASGFPSPLPQCQSHLPTSTATTSR